MCFSMTIQHCIARVIVVTLQLEHILLRKELILKLKLKFFNNSRLNILILLLSLSSLDVHLFLLLAHMNA